MKDIVIFIFMALSISCSGQNLDKENFVSSYPFLIGNWKGEGKFMNVKLDHEFGPVMVELEFKNDNSISGHIGDALITKTSIAKTEYGFEIKGILDSKVNKNKELRKKHLVFLFVVPERNNNDLKKSKSNFHLKDNFFYDITMRVGEVILTKTQ